VKKRVSVVFGTRPEAIKLAPVILALKKSPAFDCHVCVTAQHREMLDQVLIAFDIESDMDLNLMQPEQSLSDFTARAVKALDLYYEAERPDLVLVQGDTTTVFCATLAAFYHRIPVGHVEAGLRTHDLYSPWPEEANRVLTSRLAALHFAPTEISRRNLLGEGIPGECIHVTGNTVIDALFLALEKVKRNPPEIAGLPPEALTRWNDTKVVLITGHRRENFGAGFESICQAIAELARRFPETQFVYPVHLNPNVRRPVKRILGKSASRNVHLLEPLPYLAFLAMMDKAAVILTDSGGIQEEAPSLGKAVLVMREVTERPEAVSAGTARLVGTNFESIVAETTRLLTDQSTSGVMCPSHNPYGDGKATERILTACTKYFTSVRLRK